MAKRLYIVGLFQKKHTKSQTITTQTANYITIGLQIQHSKKDLRKIGGRHLQALLVNRNEQRPVTELSKKTYALTKGY